MILFFNPSANAAFTSCEYQQNACNENGDHYYCELKGWTGDPTPKDWKAMTAAKLDDTATPIGVKTEVGYLKLGELDIAAIPGVESVTPVLKPYKLVSREFRGGNGSVVKIGDVAIGEILGRETPRVDIPVLQHAGSTEYPCRFCPDCWPR